MNTLSWINFCFGKYVFLVLHWLCLSLTEKFICTTWPHMTICLFWLGSDACKHRSDLSHWHVTTKVIKPAGSLAGVRLAGGKVLRGPFPAALLSDQRGSRNAPPANLGNPLSDEHQSLGLWVIFVLFLFFTVKSFWLFSNLHLKAIFHSQTIQSLVSIQIAPFSN